MNKLNKHLILSGLAALSATYAFAQTPKSCDLAITLINPVANTVVNYGDSVALKFTVKNNGPDAIAATDSVFYDVPSGDIAVLVGYTIASGETLTIDIGNLFKNINPGEDLTTDFCINLIPQSQVTVNAHQVTTTYNDPNEANDESCNSITIKGNNTSGIFDTKTKHETLNFFPNPATSKVSFNVALEKPETVKAIVRDITGREVMTKEFGQIQTGTSAALELNVAEFSSGIYVVEVVAGDKKFIGKITKKN